MKPHCLSNLVKTVGVICAFLTPLAASADVTINSTNFPDANFRNYLKGLDIGKDGVLTTNEINNTTTFLLADLGISDLLGRVIQCKNQGFQNSVQGCGGHQVLHVQTGYTIFLISLHLPTGKIR